MSIELWPLWGLHFARSDMLIERTCTAVQLLHFSHCINLTCCEESHDDLSHAGYPRSFLVGLGCLGSPESLISLIPRLDHRHDILSGLRINRSDRR